MADYTTEPIAEPLVEKIARINAEFAVQKAELKNELKRLKDEEKAIKATYKTQFDQLKSNKNAKHLLNNEVEWEIERVHRRIPKWAKSPYQTNHKILKNYLKLLNQNDFVYLEDFENHSKTIKSFKSNFNSMKIISDHNHAKVFDVINDRVYLWEPVKNFILKEFQNVL